MSKRIVCVLLALIMLVGLIPAGVITASAASNREVSENAIKFIKDLEGFKEKAYWDNSQYSYGYGSKAPNGLATITQKEADKLLRAELKEIDAKVNGFAATHGKNFSQQQHDALVSFTYNCGWGWMSQPSYRITKAVINGSTGNEFLQAMSLWSNVDSIPQAGLVTRRMAEANMYLNGSYSTKGRDSYTYVTFDANGGVLGEDKVQAYDYNVPVSITSVPERAGYTFLGWYNQATDGNPVTVLNKDTAKKVLYAHWQKDSEVIEDNKTVIGTPASYTITGSQLASLKVYSVPNSNTTAIGSVAATDSLKVTAEYVDENNIKWVKISSGWVTLGDVQKPIIIGTSSTVTVTNAYINIRKKPNTDPTNAPIGTVKYGDKLVITEVKEVKGTLWGKFEKGWVALMYTDYNTASSNTAAGTAGVAIAEGTVTVTNTNLNVRTGAGTDKAMVGTLTNGTKVKIYEITTVGGHSWGCIGTGRWVCLDYVVYKDIVDTTPDYVNKDNVTQTTGTPYMFTATVNADGLYVYDKAGITGVTPVGSLNRNASVYIVEIQAVGSKMFGKVQLSNAVGWIQLDKTSYTAYGKVNTSGGGDLNVRTTAGAYSSNIAKDNKGNNVQLKNGTAVTILELKANDTSIWGRVKEGWISMDHVALNTTTPPVSTAPSTGNSNGNGTTVIMTGVVNSGINLNVRLGAGVNYDVVNSLPNGTQVKIYEKQLVNGHFWGKMGNNAWICLSYITDTTEQTGLGGTTGGTTAPGTSSGTAELKGVGATVYNCTSGVNIRTAPGTNSALAGSAPLGSRVTVYEQTNFNGALWARTDEGWISMLYLKLDTDPSYSNPGSSVTVNGLFAASVLTNELPVYDSISNGVYTGTAVATLVKGNAVYVTELQSYDGKTLYGKVTVGGKTGWIDLAETAYTASGVVATKEGGNLNVRKSADASADAVEQLTNGSAITIVAVKPVKSGSTVTMWGKIAENKWVMMDHVNLISTTITAPSTGTTNTSKTSFGVIFNTTSVNVRSAAGVKNPQVATLMQGTQVVVHEETVVDDAQWVRISTTTVDGWVAKKYVSISYTTNNGGTSTGTGTGTGTGTETAPSTGSNYATGYVNSNIPLNIRSLPDVNSPKVGELTMGMTITIYEQQAGGGLTWGRVDKGWVALNYVTITSTGSTGNGNMGTIIKAFSKVNVRSMPGTNNAIVGEVMVGSRVEVLDQQLYNGAVWYRISNGWVAGEYIELDAPFVSGGTNEDTTGNLTGDNMTNTDTGASDEIGGQYTTAVLKDPGNDVVKFYGPNFTDVVGSKINGTTVVITALKGIGTEVWANTADGWFNLSDNSVNFIAVGVVNTTSGNQLNVRSTAGITSDTPVAKLDNKSSITLTAVKVANGAIWGKMAKGWVALEHLDLTAEYAGVQGNTPVANNDEQPVGVSGKLFEAQILDQHLSINVYDKVDGKVVGTVENKTGTSFRINQVAASMSGVWGKTATNVNTECWIKLSDVKYTICTYVVDAGTAATTSAGGTAEVGKFETANTYVEVSNLIAVGEEIYAQITSSTNKGGWVNLKELKLWYVAPATKNVETAATAASNVIFSATVEPACAFYTEKGGSTIAGYLNPGDTVLVKDVAEAGGAMWVEMHVFVTAPDMTVTAATRWTKLSYLKNYSVTGTLKYDDYILKQPAHSHDESARHYIAKAGDSFQVIGFVYGNNGASNVYLKLKYADENGVAQDAYVSKEIFNFNKIA